MQSSSEHVPKLFGRNRRSRRYILNSVRIDISSSATNRNSCTSPAASNDFRESTRKLPKQRHIELIFKYLKHLTFIATSWALTSSEDEILVGGQAVIEGVMMRSPKGYSVAVRRQDGTIRVMKDALLSLGEKWRILKAPILRGVGVLGQALVLGIRALRFSAEEALTEDGAKHSGLPQDRAQPAKKQVTPKKDPSQVS